MCLKIISKGSSNKIDPCLVAEIELLKTKEFNRKFQTIMSCCGHGKYPKTLIVKNIASGCVFEWYSGVSLTETKRTDSRAPFYKRDSQGYYYIPEICDKKEEFLIMTKER